MPLIPQILAWQDEFARLCQQTHPHPELASRAHTNRLLATHLNEA
ncbi:hypothetical protein [Pseudomonas sp. PDM15]|jgi:hypothetical protein|nr:hypothetical protein [Pseudomonas sp. PDM15]